MNLFLIFFAAACILQRIFEVKWHSKKEGEKSALWTTVLMGAAHAVCFAGAPVEGLTSGRAGFGFWFLTGFFLFAVSFEIRRWLIRTLGSYWSVYVEIRRDHPLITTGPFKFCRHPNYFSILVEVLGYCFIFQAWLTLGLTLLFYIPALFFRIRIEERAMLNHFGEAYKHYMESTPMIFPRMKTNS